MSHPTRLPLWLTTFALALALAGCSDSNENPDDDDPDVAEDAADVGPDADAAPDAPEPDAPEADTPEADTPEADTPESDTPDEDTPEADSDDAADTVEPPTTLDFDYTWPIFDAPDDPLVEEPVDSCAVYLEETCNGEGMIRRCDIYDIDAGAFVAEPDEMLERAFLYDRWYDLWSSPDGQTAERRFTETMEPGTPEEVWTDPAVFAGWSGAGDSAIWTGTALNGFILRYLFSGTEADYQRMEEKTRVMLNFFEVTRIPGYLARHHYLRVESGTPPHPDHIYRYHDDDDDHRDIEDPESLDFLPAHYFEGLGTPRWSGDPSIDQYNGPMVAFPMVWGLIRDEALRDRIAYQMLCYLHSLRRIEIINLQENEVALEAFNSLFAGDTLDLDEGDPDFSTLDRIVMYVHPQINTANEDTYDRECGDFIQTEPWRVLDATDPGFVIDVLEFVQDIDRQLNGPNHINHFYIPSVRGGDAMHMMHLTMMAKAFTEDERYYDFLRDELLGEIRTAEVAAMMSALIMPKYCRRFYGTNITAGPLWAFNNLLQDSELDTWMQEVFRDEMYEKECADIGNANVNLMFAGAVSPEIGGDSREEALTYALEELARFGGNGGVLNDPRRTYHRPFDDVVAMFPDHITAQCPTEEERAFCEREITIFGATLDGENISSECTGASRECVMEDGMCTEAMASHPLPGPIRKWGDYGWQRSPFDIGDEHGNGTVQSPGTDYAEQYWMARFYDFVEGGFEVLAWNDTEEVCP